MGKAVVVWRSFLLPGSETFVRHQGDALPTWRAAYLGAVKAESVLARDTDLIAFPAGGLGWLALRLTGRSRRVRQVLREQAPDVVHAHFGGDGRLICASAAALGIPLVITLHGLDVTGQPARPGPRGARHRRNLRTAFRRAALILAVSEHIRQAAIDLGADPAKVRVHHTGVPVAPLPEPVAKDWDIVFVGRFVAKKGIDDLLAAVSDLAGARVLLIGAGPLLEPMRQKAAALGLDATFLGAQEPAVVASHLRAAKVFVAPSKTAPDGDSEGLPTTILEAASLGLPVVSTYHSGIPEAVRHGETGLLSAEGDRVALASNIRLLLGDPELRERLGAAGRRHVEADFDLARQTARLEELYEAVASRAAGSAVPPPARSAAPPSPHP
jgi:glycosyltransferase involved in cell wall biosynthesis